MLDLCATNPFIHAYLGSDAFGKGVFWVLIALSILSWTIVIHKTLLLLYARKWAREFSSFFSAKEPLNLQFKKPVQSRLLGASHPFFEMYKVFKAKTFSILGVRQWTHHGKGTLSDAEILEIVDELHIAASQQIRKLEKHLFILPTVITLGPFVGLLGTVWGILLSAKEMHTRATGNAEAMLSGLSLALAATVVGLMVAIPAVIGNNYLKSSLRDFRREMEDFSHLLLSSLKTYTEKSDHESENISSP